jgi:hypothetical protein
MTVEQYWDGILGPTREVVREALVDSIKLRWAPRLEDPNARVPGCQLCVAVDENCLICPLREVDSGRGCHDEGSAYEAWCGEQAAQNMVDKLQECLDRYFPGETK